MLLLLLVFGKNTKKVVCYSYEYYYNVEESSSKEVSVAQRGRADGRTDGQQRRNPKRKKKKKKSTEKQRARREGTEKKSQKHTQKKTPKHTHAHTHTHTHTRTHTHKRRKEKTKKPKKKENKQQHVAACSFPLSSLPATQPAALCLQAVASSLSLQRSYITSALTL